MQAHVIVYNYTVFIFILILAAYDDQQHINATPATPTDEWTNIEYPKEDNHAVNGSESDETDKLQKENEEEFSTPASSPGNSEVDNKTDQSVPLPSVSRCVCKFLYLSIIITVEGDFGELNY